jgi:hypothetical protein
MVLRGASSRLVRFRQISQILLPLSFAFMFFLIPALLVLLVGGRIWSAGPRRDTTPLTASTPTFAGTGGSTRLLTPSSRP